MQPAPSAAKSFLNPVRSRQSEGECAAPVEEDCTEVRHDVVRLVRIPFGTGAPVTRPATAATAMVCSSSARGETPSSIEARSRSSNSGVT